MDYWWGWVEFVWRLLQPIAVLAMAVVLFRWHTAYTAMKNATVEAQEATIQSKNAIIEMNDQRLKERDDQLKSKDEQLRAKDEQIRSKDEQMKRVEKENAALRVCSAETLQKHLAAMKTLYEEQIMKLETDKIEIQTKLEATEAQVSELQAQGDMAAGELDRLRKAADAIRRELYENEIRAAALRISEANLKSKPEISLLSLLAWTHLDDPNPALQQACSVLRDLEPNYWADVAAESTKRQTSVWDIKIEPDKD